ncbi:MAG TPA: site-2 protease family protein [Candidatus Saccharimonadales bacterium]|nr:site-2 protease family protein [Candidatus Saccharimonadales bacterium]
MFINLLLNNPILFVLAASALILSISVHEFAHAYAANKLGDFTAKYLGRLTLNPLAHLDPVGTILLLTVGFGWGKPVPYNPANLKNPARDGAIIAFSGPLSNFILAISFAAFMHFLPLPSIVTSLFYLIVSYNLILGFFNLIPIFPLDGFNIVTGLLPHRLRAQWLQMATFSMIFLIILVITGVTSKILNPVLNISLTILGLQ